MDKIEKIQAKIDRMLDDICEADGFVQKKDEPRYDALAEVLDFLNALEEEPDKSMEEAAREYAEKHGFRVPYDGSDNFYDDVDVKSSKDGFIAGAKWQEKRNEETIKTAEDHAFLAGADWQLEKMITLVQFRLSEIIGDAQPKPALRAELRELIEKIKEDK